MSSLASVLSNNNRESSSPDYIKHC